ncbi:CRAL-TRIO domain-containing protein [Corynascus novoguineensis]|uniref:Phosphatidylinositol transfer protein SFH5 n=1 Tax=Corynascus novoguineensis TaxID=1126955 RepID=A0AAN7CLH3_9PEZI|nr:CRAL-TRIO domain-containing protein [Corynascus novoguineensis]
MSTSEQQPAASAPPESGATPQMAQAAEPTSTASAAPAAEAPEASEAPQTATPETAQTVPATTTTTTITTTTEAAASVPTPDDKKEPTAESPVSQLWAVAKANGHPEIWGVTLSDPSSHVPTRIVLQKYLNANDGDLGKAKDQLTKTLEWRARTKPLELVNKVFSKAKFDGLGYVTCYQDDGSNEPESKEVFTWNIYGSVKSIEETFGKLNEFLEWRVALMELALQELDLGSATKEITADYDPYKIFQVHDYKSISFLRQSSSVKAASAETIKVFAQNYPELLKEKFFVNVPAVMGFFYTFMKLFVAPKTLKKFHPMSNGQNLAAELGESKVPKLGEKLPANYGGKGAKLEEQGKGPVLE